ncbi:MAG TPA: glycosyltransferase, partial [Anaerolineales bacterium]|nr:glycosyltransferase [Anaerolineales bacterium]
MGNAVTPARRYKIAYLIDGLSMGGAERLMVPILEHLSRAHFEPYVCAMQSKDGNPMAEELRVLGVPVECLEIRRLRDLDAVPRLTRYLKAIGADLVHTQLEAANILGNISAKMMKLPSVCTIHVQPSLDVKTKTRLHQKV